MIEVFRRQRIFFRRSELVHFLLLNLFLFAASAAFASSQALAQGRFIHPGAINGKAELDFVKAKIAAGEEPWTGKFIELRRLARPGRHKLAPGDENGQKEDGQRAYANALAWYYTGDAAYAKNAITILNVWGRTFKGYQPVDGQNLLQGGWIGALLGPAAEIVQTCPEWQPADINQVKRMFKTSFYPVLNKMSTWNGNVDLTQIDAIMSIAVFCEDESEFDLGIKRLNSRIRNYFFITADGIPLDKAFWFNPAKWVDGVTQETCRDNGHHTQYALASALHAAETAWNQGLDVYGQNSSRFIAAMELMAEQILSGRMQGVCVADNTTGDLYATWEIGYNHYHNRKSYPLSQTGQLLKSKIRPFGQSDWNIFFESLTHYLPGKP